MDSTSNVPVNPLTTQSIRAFARRRQRLIVARGFCAAVICLLGVMAVVAFLDYVFVLPDWLRWTMSGVGYASVIAVVWFKCIRLLLSAPSPTQLAALMESAQPDLHENLIAAVELGQTDSDARWDSPVFRGMLQNHVAHKLKDTPIRSLLPGRLIVWWLRIAAVVGIVTAALLLIPGSPYPKLIVRAMVPAANIGRVAEVQVQIVAPTPADAIVPQGDVLAVAARISGLQPDAQATLETWRPTEGGEQLRMLPAGSSEFRATLQIGRESVRYRVRAGDAVTRWYTIDARQRPHVDQFVKVYRFPQYTAKPPQTVTEDAGDLAALEGTSVDLTLTASQPINSGELIVELDGKTTNIPVKVDSAHPTQLHAVVPMTASGTYRVRVVAAESGFENKFSPQYEIRAEPDLIPRVQIDQPNNNLVLPADDLVTIAGRAADDMSLVSVSQSVRVNKGPWTQTVVKDDPGQQASISQKLDLMGLDVHPGDQVTYKLVALDRKGNRGESAPLLITISAQGFDPARLTAMEKFKAVGPALDEVAKAVKYQQEQTAAAMLQTKRDADPNLRQQAMAGLQQAADQLDHAAKSALNLIGAAMHDLHGSREAEYLGAVGRIVSETRRTTSQAGLIDVANADDSQMLDVLRRLAQRSTDRQKDMQHAIGGYQVMLASHAATLALSDAMHMAAEQDQLKQMLGRDGDDQNKWQRIARRLQLAKAQLAQIAQMFDDVSAQTDVKLAHVLDIHKVSINRMIQMLDRVDQDFSGKRLTSTAQQFESQLKGMTARLADLHQSLAGQADAAEGKLARITGPTSDALALLGREAKLEPSPNSLDGRWQAAVGQLEDRANLDEVRSDSDARFVSDLTLGAQAMRDAWLHNRSMKQLTAESIARLDAISNAVAVLEAGHGLVQNMAELQRLATDEQWRLGDVDVLIRSPVDWNWLLADGKALAASMQQVHFPANALSIVDQAYQSLQSSQIGGQMDQRAKSADKAESVAAPMRELRGKLRLAMQQITPMMEEARKVLAQNASPLSQIAADLAKQVRDLKKQTDQAAADADKQPADKAAKQAKDLAEKQEQLNKQVQQVKDALRRDANAQNQMTKEGRERARDDDDATALLKDPPPKAQAHLDQAAADKTQRKENLDKAAEQQEKLADALQLVADHQKNLEEGKPDETRQALRNTEQDTGVKQDLDKQYAQMEKLAEMTAQAPQQMQKSLQQELPLNQTMQKELAQIAQQTADQAQEQLQDAANQENKINQQLKPLAQQEQKKPAVSAADVKKIADQAKQLAQKDVPQAAKSANQAQTNADKPLKDADKQLNDAADNANKAAKQDQVPAEDVAAMAKKLQQASDNLHKAQQAAEEKADDAKAQQQQAEEQLAKAQQTGQPDAEAAKAKLDAMAAKEAADKAKQDARQAADKAEALAQQAAALADQAQQAQQANQQQMAEGAKQQDPIAQAAEEAAKDIQRAADFAQQLNQPEAAQAMQQAAQTAQQAAKKDVPQAKQAMAAGQSAQQAQQAVDAAHQQLQKGADQLAQAAQAAAAAQQPPPAAEQPAPGQWMAQAMDQQAQQNTPAAQQAMQQAAQAQAQQMAMARAEQNMPTMMPGPDSPSMQAMNGSAGNGAANGELTQDAATGNAQWGDLPPKLARDLVEAQREQVAPEYREQVDAYFKALATQAKDKP